MNFSKNKTLKSVMIVALSIIFAAAPAAASRYIVMLEDPISLSGVQLKDDYSNRGDIINLLQENSSMAINSFAQGLSNDPDVRMIKQFWAINSILVDAEKSSLEQISNLPGVIGIYADEPAGFDTPVNSGRKAVESKNDEFTYGLKNLNVPQVWNELGVKGEGILVGIIDTGITYEHPEWKDAGKIVHYWETTGPTSPEGKTDTNGHGSHVAGTIAGGNLSGKYIGVAPEAKLMIAKGIAGWYSSDLLGAMEYMLNPEYSTFPRVVNCSWTSGSSATPPYYKMIQRWLDLGIFPAFSAGNSGPSASTITKPKEYPGSFASAALDSTGTIARFSSRGPALYNGEEVEKPDLASPGVDVYSVKASGGYTTKSGTSMASPHTAGVAALVLSARPNTTVSELRRILLAAAADNRAPGHDTAYGHGRLDAYLAVKLALKKAELDKANDNLDAVLRGYSDIMNMEFSSEKAKYRFMGLYQEMVDEFLYNNMGWDR